MDLAALIILIATVIVAVASIVSVKYTRGQARAAQDRRHMDRTPHIGHAFVPRMGGHYYLQLRNDGPGDLDRVEVELLLDPEAPFESGLREISDEDGPGGTASTMVSFGPWRLGETRRLGLWRTGAMRRVTNLRCTCYLGGSKPWQVLVDAQPPPDA